MAAKGTRGEELCLLQTWHVIQASALSRERGHRSQLCHQPRGIPADQWHMNRHCLPNWTAPSPAPQCPEEYKTPTWLLACPFHVLPHPSPLHEVGPGTDFPIKSLLQRWQLAGITPLANSRWSSSNIILLCFFYSVSVVNLLLWIIYKLNFDIDMFVWKTMSFQAMVHALKEYFVHHDGVIYNITSENRTQNERE